MAAGVYGAAAQRAWRSASSNHVRYLAPEFVCAAEVKLHGNRDAVVSTGIPGDDHQVLVLLVQPHRKLPDAEVEVRCEREDSRVLAIVEGRRGVPVAFVGEDCAQRLSQCRQLLFLDPEKRRVTRCAKRMQPEPPLSRLADRLRRNEHQCAKVALLGHDLDSKAPRGLLLRAWSIVV